MKVSVFISHCWDGDPDARHGRYFAELLRHELAAQWRNEAVRIFFDSLSLDNGDRISENVLTALATCTHFVALDGGAFRQSHWCPRELEAFERRLRSSEDVDGRILMVAWDRPEVTDDASHIPRLRPNLVDAINLTLDSAYEQQTNALYRKLGIRPMLARRYEPEVATLVHALARRMSPTPALAPADEKTLGEMVSLLRGASAADAGVQTILQDAPMRLRTLSRVEDECAAAREDVQPQHRASALATDPNLESIAREVIRFEAERNRHRYGLVGRHEVVEDIVEWIDATRCGWLLLEGSPGVGKSAIMSHLLERLDGMGIRCAYHFVRAGVHDDPRVVRANLAAQVALVDPNSGDAASDLGRNIVELLGRVGRKGKLVLLVDGLDEAATPVPGENPIPGMLPHELPDNVVALLASRPTYPHLAWVKARRPVPRTLELDRRSGDAVVEAFWAERASQFDPPLSRAVLRKLLEGADGNMLHATSVYEIWKQEHGERRRKREPWHPPEGIPQGLDALAEVSWRKVVADAPKDERGAFRDMFAALAFARDALPLSALGVIVGVDEFCCESFLERARPFLLEEPAHWRGEPTYRLFHEALREYVSQKAASHVRRIHGALAAWAEAAEPETFGERYALRYAVWHLVEAGRVDDAQTRCRDIARMTRQAVVWGIHAVESDLELVERIATDNTAVFSVLLTAVRQELHWLRSEPSVLPVHLYNRLLTHSRASLEAYKWPDLDDAFVLVRPLQRGSSTERMFACRHTEWIRDFVVLPDGRVVAASGYDLSVWSLSDGSRTILEGHTGLINAMAVLPDGRIVSASDDHTLRVWDANAGSSTVLKGHTDKVSVVAVLPDGRVVSGSEDQALRAWNADDGSSTTFEGHTEGVKAVAVLPDGRVVSLSGDGTLRVWNAHDGSSAVFHGGPKWVNAVAALPDCRVVVASAHCNVRVWNVNDGSSTVLEGHTKWVSAVAVLPDGRVVSASWDDTLRVWNVNDASSAVLEGHTDRVSAVAVLPDGRVVSASEDCTLRVWNVDDGSSSLLAGHSGRVSVVAALPGGRVVSAAGDRTLRVWNVDAGVSTVLTGHSGRVSSVAVLPDGRVVSASTDRTLRVWNADQDQSKALEGHTAPVNAVTAFQDARVISASEDHTLRVWNPNDGSSAVLVGLTAWANAIAVLPDDCLVAAFEDHTLRVWNPNDDSLTVFEGHEARVSAIAVLPDGRAVSASTDRTLRVWDAKDGSSTVLEGHAACVNAIAVLPDGRVVSASHDRTLRLWDVKSGSSTILEGHTAEVNAVTVLADGRIVSASEDRTVRIWDLDDPVPRVAIRGEHPFTCIAATAGHLVAGDAHGNVWFLRWPRATTRAR